MSDAGPPARYTVLLVFEDPRMRRFLMARHRDRGWELPGGRVENGEDLLTAARREWAEEVGLPLRRLAPLVVHDRPDGSEGHLFLGAAYDIEGRHASPHGTSGDVAPPDAEDKIVGARFVDALADVAPLAFTDDPYDALARAALRAAHHLGWPGPSDAAADRFVDRIRSHPEATPQDHPVRPHPLASAAAATV